MTQHTNTRGWLVPALGASALYAILKTREVEKRYPPIGDFMAVDSMRLHYIERGRGEPLVLIHGNGEAAEFA